jgi:hypothetical protein
MAVGSARSAHALQATWTGGVLTAVFDANCVPGQFACGDRNSFPPDSAVVDLSVSFTRIVSNVTHFALASLTAFVDGGDALLVSGVAQSDALKSPALPFGCCMVGGESTFSLTFDATTVPLAVEIFETAHRVGPNWGNLVPPGGITFSGSDLFVDLPAPLNEGDASFEYHTILAPNSGSYHLNVLAAFFLNSTTTTGETRIVWDFRVTPVPWPATALVVCFSFALMVWRHKPGA